jgi:polysaccharide biosynthesis transport protein
LENLGLLSLIKRWWMYLVLGAVVGGLVGQYAAGRMSPAYEAEAKLLVGPINTEFETLRASGELGRTYAELATSRPVLEHVIKKTKAPTTPNELINDGAITATSNEITRVVSIVVTFGDPKVAADLANAIGDRIRDLSEATPQQETIMIRTLLEQDEIERLTEPQRQAVGEAARRVLGRSLAGYVEVVDPASADDEPVSPNKPLITLLAALVGMIAVGVIALVRDASTRLLADERSLAALEHPSFLGTIEVPNTRRGSEGLIVEGGRESVIEAFRGIATKVGFFDDQPPVTSLVVLDSTDGRRSGVVAANLAAVLAQSGRRVLLLDANTATGGVTTSLGLDGRPGYTELLDVLRSSNLNGDADSLRVSRTPGLEVLPRGTGEVASALDVDSAKRLLNRSETDVDVVIVCAAPVDRSPAALVWARVTDGTMLVVDDRQTSADRVEEAVRSLAFVGATVVGTVLARSARPFSAKVEMPKLLTRN